MYNLNVNLAQSAANAVNSLLVEGACTTPRTPEILNSLIAMTNPLDNYQFEGKLFTTTTKPHTNCISSDSNSSTSSQMESPTSNNPPSVQHTCSQLIKAGLKLSIEQKRKHQSDGEDLLDLDKCKKMKKTDCSESEEDRQKQDGIHNWTWYENDDCLKLTPEDEERRRRRRERNKIAATKCRLKKREKTANLVNESETLETQNVDLKQQLQELQKQKHTLMEMLTNHRPHCQQNITPATRDTLFRLPPVGSVIENNYHHHQQQQQQNHHHHHRPASAEPITNNYRNLDTAIATAYHRNYGGNKAPPSILVEEVTDYQPQLTNLDNYNYNNQCHNNYNSYSTTGMDNGCMA